MSGLPPKADIGREAVERELERRASLRQRRR